MKQAPVLGRAVNGGDQTTWLAYASFERSVARAVVKWFSLYVSRADDRGGLVTMWTRVQILNTFGILLFLYVGTSLGDDRVRQTLYSNFHKRCTRFCCALVYKVYIIVVYRIHLIYLLAPFRVGSQGPVLLQRSDAVTSLSANGSAAFKESCAPIG